MHQFLCIFKFHPKLGCFLMLKPKNKVPSVRAQCVSKPLDNLTMLHMHEGMKVSFVSFFCAGSTFYVWGCDLWRFRVFFCKFYMWASSPCKFNGRLKNNKKIRQLNKTKRKRALVLKSFVYKLPKFRGRYIRPRRVVWSDFVKLDDVTIALKKLGELSLSWKQILCTLSWSFEAFMQVKIKFNPLKAMVLDNREHEDIFN